MKKNLEHFYLIIVDEESKKFNVEKMCDDTWINEKIVQLQKEGRKVRCFNSGATDENIKYEIEKYKIQKSYEYVKESVL